MPAKPIDWSGDKLPIIDSHSMAKHNILSAYVRKYINVLMQNQKIPKLDITLVDGFAGGGAYETKSGQIWDGSSLVLLRAVENAILDINENRREPRLVNAEFHFIEESATNYQCLCRTLLQRGYRLPHDTITVSQGKFENHLNSLIANIKKKYGASHRVIFVLDQYGYSDVYIENIRTIFSELPNSEIFLTLAVEYILRYRRELSAVATELCRGLRIEDPHMNLLLSDIADEQIIDSSGSQKNGIMRALQRLLHDIFTKRVNARYYTPFFITSAKTWASYWFLHLANSYRANDVVKELHWTQHNHFKHYGDPGFNMLGYDPKKNVSQQAFDFDLSAEEQTRIALVDSVPRHLHACSGQKLSVRELYSARCNETPASLTIFRSAIDALVLSGEIDKEGDHGERRRIDTAVKPNDRISIAKQLKFFDLGATNR